MRQIIGRTKAKDLKPSALQIQNLLVSCTLPRFWQRITPETEYEISKTWYKNGRFWAVFVATKIRLGFVLVPIRGIREIRGLPIGYLRLLLLKSG